MWAARWFFVLLVLILVSTFSISNISHITDVTIIPGYVEFKQIAVSWIVWISFLCGMLVTFGIAAIKFIQMNIALSKKDKQLGLLHEELTSMRNEPLKDEKDESNNPPESN